MSTKEITHCQIDKVEGEPYLPHHFCVYINGKLVAGDVPVQMLGAVSQLIDAIIYALECEKDRSVPNPVLIEVLEEALEAAGVEVDHE